MCEGVLPHVGKAHTTPLSVSPNLGLLKAPSPTGRKSLESGLRQQASPDHLFLTMRFGNRKRNWRSGEDAGLRDMSAGPMCGCGAAPRLGEDLRWLPLCAELGWSQTQGRGAREATHPL